MQRLAIPAALLICVAVGCDRPQASTAQPTTKPSQSVAAKPDFDAEKANQDLKGIAAKLLPLVLAKGDKVAADAEAQTAATVGPRHTALPSRELTLIGTDIKSSDSLVHPHVAQIVWDERIISGSPTSPNMSLRFRETLEMVQQGSMWVPSKAYRVLEDEMPYSGPSSLRGKVQEGFPDFYADLLKQAQG